jgi:hypothetical protein
MNPARIWNDTAIVSRPMKIAIRSIPPSPIIMLRAWWRRRMRK